jgi:Golgi nucleoside diphosphatase
MFIQTQCLLLLLVLLQLQSGKSLEKLDAGMEILTTIFTDKVSPLNTHGLLIDGGSGGSRIHIYQWEPRVFHTVPAPISFPTTNDLTSLARIGGGVQECWQPDQTKEELMEKVAAHINPMLDFARNAMSGQEKHFHSMPIWFKATGGARELTPQARDELLNAIRTLLKASPFYFRHEMARVISGEEEAVFSWACMNFLKGNLIPSSNGYGGHHDSVSYVSTRPVPEIYFYFY